MRRPDQCPTCSESARGHTGSYCHGCGESLTKFIEPQMNPFVRLQSLARSPEQDAVIRRLLNAKMRMTMLDVANPGEVILFRDINGQRWVVTRSGEVTVPGRTNWRIITDQRREVVDA